MNDTNIVDLIANMSVHEDLLTNKDIRLDIARQTTGDTGWNETFSLFNVSSSADHPGYFIWKVALGAGKDLTLEMNFKNWAGVGNGGVAKNGAAKLAYYYTTDLSKALDGSFDGWTAFGSDVAWNGNVYNYTIPVTGKFDTDTELYIMIRCCSPDDGAWIDGITFTTEKEAPPEEKPVETPEDKPSVDLINNTTVEENILENQNILLDYARLDHAGNGWNVQFGLLNVTCPAESPNPPGYFIWKIALGAGNDLFMRLDFKDWSGVGNGGVAKDGTAKLAFYYTTDLNRATDGSTEGWTLFGTDVAWDGGVFSYTIPVTGKFSTDTELYVMIRCCSPDDGAWIDHLAFSTVEKEQTGIKITAKPRTEYTEGEQLDLAGLEVSRKFSDGSLEVMTSDEYTVTPDAGYTLTVDDRSFVVTDKTTGDTAKLSLKVKAAEATPPVDTPDDPVDDPDDPVDDPDDPGDSADDPETKGCKSALTLGTGAMVLLLGAWVVLASRKKED